MSVAQNSIRLFTPGPTQIPRQVLECMQGSHIHHRSQEFEQCYLDVQASFKKLLGEETQTAVLSCSGSGGMEATVASCFSSGDEVVVVHAGKFGKRWLDLCTNYDLNIKAFSCPWGEAADHEEIINWVKKHKPKAVFIQACETSTGVFHPVYALGEALKSTDTLLIVDAITALAIYPFNLNKDGIDVLIGGSQKALMCPPGLSTVSFNEKAKAQLLDASRSYYFSLQKEFKSQQSGASAFTPAVALFFGLQEALTMILKESMSQVHIRHQFLQKVCRQYFRSIGFELLNHDAEAALGLTAVKGKSEFNIQQFLMDLKQNYQLWLAGGQNDFKGKIFRFAHMGYCYPQDVSMALKNVHESLSKQLKIDSLALEQALNELEKKGGAYENPHL